MILAGSFLLVAAGCAVLAVRLTRANWPWRAPSAAIALWQAIGLAWGLAVIGAALAAGLAPYGRGVAPGLLAFAEQGSARLDAAHHAALAAGLLVSGVLLFALAACGIEVFLARRRHRSLLALVAHGDPGAPEALVLDHPAAAAYCVPGVRARIVVSAGTLRLLDRTELAAVLAHERAHARERHDLVLLPFTSLRRVLPSARVMQDVIAAVMLLVEMRADDRARHQHSSRPLASALARFGTGSASCAPCGALGVGDEQLLTRVRRLLSPQPGLPRRAHLAVLSAAVFLVTVPVGMLLVPLS